MVTQTNPLIALLLSLIVPGAGQLYNGEAKKGWVILACCLSLGALTYWITGLNKITVALALLLLWLSAMVDAYRVAKTTGQAAEFYYGKTYVVTMLLLVGPLALPLLWQSPNFSRASRLVWTVIVVGAVLLFIATPFLIDRLIPQADDLRSRLGF
jgi:TM2 domain-containing membrane protein YozV